MEGFAEELGLDVKAFSRGPQRGHLSRGTSTRPMTQAVALGLGGTPTLYVNGQLYNGPREDWVLGRPGSALWLRGAAVLRRRPR